MLALARCGPMPAMLLCDRGLLDSKAYVPVELWQDILDDLGSTDEQLRARYDLILHFVTAADGAREAYTTAGNAARLETPEEAIKCCAAMARVYGGHPAVKRIENSEDGFEGKIRRASAALVLLPNS